MYNLVKNELSKIFHKKGIYVLAIFTFIVFVAGSLFEKYFPSTLDSYYDDNIAQDILNNYDVSDSDQLYYFIDYKASYEAYKIRQEYDVNDYESLDYYYIDNNIYSHLVALYTEEYVGKNEERFKEYQRELVRMKNKIHNVDWQEPLLEEKASLEEELKNTDNQNDKEKIQDRLLAIKYRLDNNIPVSYSEESEFVETFTDASSSYYMSKDDSNMGKAEKQEAKKNYFEKKYILENNVGIKDESFIGILYEYSGLSMFIFLVIFVVCGGIIADEFNKGTVKQLFVRPYSRSKILTSKFIAALITIVLFMVWTLCLEYISYIIAGGNPKIIFEPLIVYDFKIEQIVHCNVFKYLGLEIIAMLPEILFYAVLCLLVGTITTNAVVTITMGMGVFVFGSLFSFADKIDALLPYNNLNFNKYLYGGISSNSYQSFTSSFIIMIVTLGVLLGLTYLIFKKKDVKNQ